MSYRPRFFPSSDPVEGRPHSQSNAQPTAAGNTNPSPVNQNQSQMPISSSSSQPQSSHSAPVPAPSRSHSFPSPSELALHGSTVTDSSDANSHSQPQPQPSGQPLSSASGVSSSHSKSRTDDDSLTRSRIVQLLQSQSNDKSCRILAQALANLSPAAAELSNPANLIPLFHSSADPSILLHIVQSVKSSPPSSTLSSTDWHRALAYLCLLLSLHLHRLVVQILLELVESLNPHIQYWRTHPRPGIPALIHQKLFTSKPNKTAKGAAAPAEPLTPRAKLHELLRFRKKWLTRVGQLSLRVSKLRIWLSKQLSSATLISAMEQCAAYTEQLYAFVSGENQRRSSSISDVLALQEESLLGLEELKEWWNEQIKPLRKPGHFQRNWHRYLTGTAIALFTAKTVWKHRDAIHGSMNSANASLKLFFQEHVVEPFTNLYNIVFDTFTSKTQMDSARANFEESKSVLQNMLQAYGQANADQLAKQEGLSKAAFLASLEKRSKALDMGLVMKNYEQEVSSSTVSNILFGDLVKGILIQGQKVKVDGEMAMLTMDQILRSNAINFNVLAAFPAVALGFVCISIAQSKLNTMLFGKPDMSSLYSSIKEKMLAIEALLIHYCYPVWNDPAGVYTHLRFYQQLNEREEMEELHDLQHPQEIEEFQEAHQRAIAQAHIHAQAHSHSPAAASPSNAASSHAHSHSSPGSASAESSRHLAQASHHYAVTDLQQYMRDWSYGQLLLLVFETEKLIAALKQSVAVRFRRDLQLLAAAHLTPEQKLMTVERMYRAYPFLARAQ